MKDKQYFILTIIFILVLSFVTHWQFKNFQKTSSGIQFPKFEMPEFNPPFPSESAESKEFISPDGKLKLKYSSEWIEFPKESLKNLNKEIVKTGSEILFFAQKFNLKEAAFASLVVQELNSESGSGLEEIIENIKKEAEEKNVEMEIIKLEIEERKAYLETKYQQEGGDILHSKEKIILTEDKIYLIDFISPDKNWLQFEKEAEEIFDSVQIID
jgi:Fe2+ transport system protein B